MSSRPDPPANTRLRRWPWTVLALATMLAVGARLDAQMFRKDITWTQSGEVAYHRPITELDISGPSMFTLSRGPGAHVRVSATRTWKGTVHAVIHQEWAGTSLKIYARCDGQNALLTRMIGSSCGITIHVQIPATVAVHATDGAGRLPGRAAGAVTYPTPGRRPGTTARVRRRFAPGR